MKGLSVAADNRIRLPEVLHGGRFASDRCVDYHTHAGAELVMVTEGCCAYLVADRILEGRVGSVFVLPAGVPQRQESPGFARTSYVTFRSDPAVFSESARVVDLDNDPAGEWLERLVDIALVSGGAGRDSARAALLAILLRISEVESRERELRHLHPALVRALGIVEREIALPFDAERLAGRCGISVSRLNVLFREAFGGSPLQRVIALRMEMACRLLPDPRLRVNDVARLCGFEDAGYFIRVFRRTHGATPGRWRRNAEGNPGAG